MIVKRILPLGKARLDLIGEIQAIFDYDEHINTTNNQIARETWTDIKHLLSYILSVMPGILRVIAFRRLRCVFGDYADIMTILFPHPPRFSPIAAFPSPFLP